MFIEAGSSNVDTKNGNGPKYPKSENLKSATVLSCYTLLNLSLNVQQELDFAYFTYRVFLSCFPNKIVQHIDQSHTTSQTLGILLLTHDQLNKNNPNKRDNPNNPNRPN